MTTATISDMAKALSLIEEELADAERSVQLRLQEHMESVNALRAAIISRDELDGFRAKLFDLYKGQR